MIKQKKTRNVNTIEIPPVAVSLLDEDDGTGRGLCFGSLSKIKCRFPPMSAPGLQPPK